jgi:hypothetical protein
VKKSPIISDDDVIKLCAFEAVRSGSNNEEKQTFSLKIHPITFRGTVLECG